VCSSKKQPFINHRKTNYMIGSRIYWTYRESHGARPQWMLEHVTLSMMMLCLCSLVWENAIPKR
jgi:hypothetical protein